MENKIFQFIMMFLDRKTINVSEKSSSINNVLPEELLSRYIDTITSGRNELKSKFFTKKFRYRFSNEMARGDQYLFLKYLELNAKMVDHSNTSIDIMEKSDKICFAKVRLNLPTFVREDHITLLHSHDGWKLHKLIMTTV